MFSSDTFFEADYYMTLCWLPPAENKGMLKDIIIEGREKKEIQAADFPTAVLESSPAGLLFWSACFSAHKNTSQVMFLFYITWEVYTKSGIDSVFMIFCCLKKFTDSAGNPQGRLFLVLTSTKTMTSCFMAMISSSPIRTR